jgi:hypothetical protein
MTDRKASLARPTNAPTLAVTATPSTKARQAQTLRGAPA